MSLIFELVSAYLGAGLIGGRFAVREQIEDPSPGLSHLGAWFLGLFFWPLLFFVLAERASLPQPIRYFFVARHTKQHKKKLNEEKTKQLEAELDL